MAIRVVVAVGDLDPTLVMIPERYDPRRSTDTVHGVHLEQVASLRSQTVRPGQDLEGQPILVLDTSDAREGVIRPRNDPISSAELRSTKKLLQPGDVVISRLRPYLRQVGYVDSRAIPAGALLACSTEFFVLRARDDQSIAFLVPFLLRTQVQQILAASQEGGHHPRFNADVLRMLPIPNAVLESRDSVSTRVVRALREIRKGEAHLAQACSQS